MCTMLQNERDVCAVYPAAGFHALDAGLVSRCRLGVSSWGSEQPRRGLAATPAKAANYIFHLDKNGGFLPMLLIIMRGI